MPLCASSIPARAPPAWMASAILVKTLQAAPTSQLWTLVAIIGVGVVLMLVARIVLRPQFFHLRRETEGPVR